MSAQEEAGLQIIAAVAENGVIGKDGDLPWRIPEDLKRFKRLTSGHAIIMGRKTYESIGRPLPKRRNIVVSRDPGYSAEGCETATSLPAAIELALGSDPCPFVIGGASLYEEALEHATVVHLTEVKREAEGDVFFPAIPEGRFVEVAREPAESEDGVDFVTLRRAHSR